MPAFKMMQAAVNAKDHNALVTLEDCYCDSVVVKHNYDAAVNSYKRAADQHVVFAYRRIEDSF